MHILMRYLKVLRTLSSLEYIESWICLGAKLDFRLYQSIIIVA